VLAVKELLGSRLKFTLIALAIGLVVSLTLLMSAMSEGLVTGMTGAKRSLDADLLVFQGDTSLALERSILSDQDLATISATAGVAKAYAVGHLVATVRGADGPFDVHVFGLGGDFEQVPISEGERRAPGPGEAIVDATARSEGVAVGDLLTLTPLDRGLRVIAFTEGRRYIMAPAAYVDLGTWRALRSASLVEDADASDVLKGGASIAAVKVDLGTTQDDVAMRLGTSFEVSTPEEASMAGNGMGVMVLAVNGIQLVSLFIGAVVIGVFFYITTLHKSGQIAAVKALGASNIYVYRQLLVQITILVTIAAILGVVLALGAGSGMPPAMAFDPDRDRWTLSLFAVYFTAYAGSLFSLRNILLVDPATALDRAEH
jgi:putative ABC transport system permease protein